MYTDTPFGHCGVKENAFIFNKKTYKEENTSLVLPTAFLNKGRNLLTKGVLP